MMDTDLCVRVPLTLRCAEQLSIHQGSPCFQADMPQDVSAPQLKATIQIAHLDSQDQTNNHLPVPGVEFAQPGILALETIATDRKVQERFRLKLFIAPVT